MDSVEADVFALASILDVIEGRLSAKSQPESDSSRHRFGALLTLMWPVEAFAADAKLRRALQPELRRLKDDIVALAARPAARRQTA